MSSTINATTTSGIQVTGDNSGSLALQTNNGTTAVTIDTSQNVGIGTSSPAQKLHVAGTIRNSAGTNALDLLNSGTLQTWDANGSNIAFYTGGERMRIDSSGNLLVGTTTATSGYLLKVGGGGAIYASGNHSFAANSNELNLCGATQATADVYVNYRNSATTISTYRFMNGAGAGTYAACVATSFTPSSDYRIKSDIQDIPSVLDAVCALRPVNYEKEGLEGREFGLIAHEAQSYFPDIVRGDKDAVDEDGDMVVQTVNYMGLTAILVKSIQELKQIVDAQAAEIAALKTKVGG